VLVAEVEVELICGSGLGTFASIFAMTGTVDQVDH
jgi:hypothetical protein